MFDLLVHASTSLAKTNPEMTVVHVRLVFVDVTRVFFLSSNECRQNFMLCKQERQRRASKKVQIVFPSSNFEADDVCWLHKAQFKFQHF